MGFVATLFNHDHMVLLLFHFTLLFSFITFCARVICSLGVLRLFLHESRSPGFQFVVLHLIIFFFIFIFFIFFLASLFMVIVSILELFCFVLVAGFLPILKAGRYGSGSLFFGFVSFFP